MFKELQPLLAKRSLTITVAALNGEEIRVNVIPHSRPEDTKVNEQIKYSHKDEVAAIPDAAIKALTTPISAQTSFPQSSQSAFRLSSTSGILSGGGTTVYDSATTTIMVSGYGSTASWSGSGTTPTSVASSLASAINNDPYAYVSASASGGVVSLTSKIIGLGGNLSLACSSAYDSSNFAQPSFGIACPSALSGGKEAGSLSVPMLTLYRYDALNNLLQVIQQGGTTDQSQWRTRSFNYDSLSRLLVATNPESGAISYSYDANGNVKTKTDPRGVITTFSYDALNRVTNKSYSDGQTSAAHFLYDVPSSWGYPITNVVGRLSEAYIDTCPDGVGNKSGGNSVFSYDPLGRIILHAQSTPSNCGTGAWPVSATYDLAGNMTSITYPSGRKVINQYDAASRLNLVQYQSWQGVTYYYGTYNYLNVTDFFPSGAPKSVTLGSGMVESYEFNPRLQPSRDTVNMPGAATFLDRIYGYGTQNNGNVMSVADQLNPAYTQTFTYDALNRLATAGEAGSRWGLNFGYDAWGNFLQQNVTSGTAGGHAYLSMPTNRLVGYTYDAAGNTSGDGFHQYAYDGENRITSVDTTTAKYGYDANGNRVRKDVGANYTEYLYFGGNIIAEHDQAGGWSDYIFANGKRIAKADDYEHQIQVSGQVCSACGTQTYSLAFSNLGSLAGHVIQSGDVLRWQQWQNTGTFGGITVNLTDGTKSVAIGSAANLWQSFAVDLSTLQGKTISSIALYEDSSTQPGAWTLYYQDIVFTAANGTVQPLFSQNSTVPALTGSGTSGVTSVSTAIHICLDPGCAPINTTTYYHGDQIGSSRMLTNGHGYPVWQGTFLPFGEEYNSQITDNHYKFTSKERDSETQLDYFGARYYSNGLGRFITPDWASKATAVPYAEFADPQSLNLYSYVRNSPTTTLDPDGHCPPCPMDGLPEDKKGDFGEMLKGAWNRLVTLSVTALGLVSDGQAGFAPGGRERLQPQNSSQRLGAQGVDAALILAPLIGEEMTAARAMTQVVDMSAQIRMPSMIATTSSEESTALIKLSGPFYRLDNNAQAIADSGILFGTPARNIYAADSASVKAYVGELPAGRAGIEFFTPTPPDSVGAGTQGSQAWWFGAPNSDVTSIPISPSKVVPPQ